MPVNTRKGISIAYGAALAATACLGQDKAILAQPFETLDAIAVAATSGSTNLSTSVDPEGVAPGSRCIRTRWHSLRENGAVGITWDFPPTDLTGRKFILWLKPVTPIRYFTIHVMDDKGRRIERHTWFGTPAGGWRIMKWWAGTKTFEDSFESSDTAGRTRAARIVFSPGGGVGMDGEVVIDQFEEEPDLLRWLIRERPNRREEGVSK